MSVTTEIEPTASSTTEPRIVAFVCKWCTYAGADLAGTSRMTYPPNVRTVMLPCTGRIDVTFIIKAFLQGADGVIVSGCHPGDCHYTAGNYRARRRWTLFRDLLDTVGFDLRRFELAWISAAEGAKWVKTISSFTDQIRNLGPYHAMRKVAQNRTLDFLPIGQIETLLQPAMAQVKPIDPALVSAVQQALSSGKAKAVIGWTSSPTLAKPRAAWISSPEAAGELVDPGSFGNLIRLFKNPQIKTITPIGIIARASEMLALNVLIQEAQIDPQQVVIFGVNPDGTFAGEMDAQTGSAALLGAMTKTTSQPVGFSDSLFKRLDELMALPADKRWDFWAEQSSKCLKCYACRQACPACGCEQCFADKNQPQWFPTAADGPGNFAWHLIRGFHLAGRCVGCEACQNACPAGIPLNLIGAAMARSALKHFDHQAGVDAKAIPLQSDYKPNDQESFIL
jgi:coenzyme F420-reducing hydrogenase delta subunit/ferredoxin